LDIKVLNLAYSFLFFKEDSPIHKLDLRVRIVIFFEYLILSIILFHLKGQLILLALITLIIILSKVYKRILKSLTLLGFLSSLIFSLNFLISQDIFLSLQYTLRFLLIFLITSSFFLTVNPDELDYFLRLLKIPKYFRFALVSSLRFVPLIILDLIQVIDSQRSRGLELEKGSILKRVKNLYPILLPLIMITINRSERIAEALETRGFNWKRKDTLYLDLKMKKRDILFLLLFSLLPLLGF